MRNQRRFIAWKSAVVAAVLLIGMAWVLVAPASPARRGWRPAPPPSFSVTVQSETGESARTFRHAGRTFVLGEPGERYTLRIHNPTARRVEAVVSVDGRDVVSGDVADFVRDRGYVIPAFGSVTVDGFRTSLDTVAAFRFTRARHSYAARLGTAEHVGVIGVAFFPERARDEQKIARRTNAAAAKRRAAPGASAHADEDRLGTAFGEARRSAVTEVAFTRANRAQPARVISVFYDDASGLRARGIDIPEPRWRRVSVEPQPFPRSRFAAPPPDGW